MDSAIRDPRDVTYYPHPTSEKPWPLTTQPPAFYPTQTSIPVLLTPDQVERAIVALEKIADALSVLTEGVDY